jgi:hypothetical protein
VSVCFNYQSLLVDTANVARSAAETGKSIFEHLCRPCI